MSSESCEEMINIKEECKKLLDEFGWNSFNETELSDCVYNFPKPFNESFQDCMNTLH